MASSRREKPLTADMEDYKYPVYFNVPFLNDRLKRKIGNYFQILRKSGGGECGPVGSVRGNTCKIAFKDEVAQQRVLQKQSHTLETEDGCVELFVHPVPDVASAGSYTDSLNSAGTSASGQMQSFPSTPGMDSQYEKTLQLDSYLLRYLRDNPEARIYLEHLLSPHSDSFQLYPEEGNIVVKTTVPPEHINQWEDSMDKVYEHIQSKYNCHYETDSLKLQALEESPYLVSDNLQVYKEAGEGFSVLVGETEKVKERLLLLGTLRGRGGSVAMRRVSTVCYLGEAQLNLLGGDLERDLKEQFPGLGVSRPDKGRLVVEGVALDVRQARERVKAKAAQVEERVVSGISSDLLTFLRRLGPEALANVLGQASVLAELDDMSLRLLSLSLKDLEAAQRALLSHMKEEEVAIPDLPELLPKLKEALHREALNQNQGKPRVEVHYRSNIVRLLGFREHVSRLKEVVHRVFDDEAICQVSVNLPYEDLSDHVSDLMALLNLDQKGVQVSVPSSHQPPVVVLTGPRHLVMPLKDKIGRAFASLVQETVTIDLPGALSYFNGAGKEYLQSVGRTHQCLVQVQGSGGPREPSYRLEGGLRVLVRLGDITQQRADALVNAANENLEHNGGVAAALSRAGGPNVQRESREIVRQMGKVATGTAVATTPGNLPCKVLVHVVGPMWHRITGSETQMKTQLEKAVRAALELAEGHGCCSLAMPCISSGIFGVPVSLCASAIVTAVRAFGRTPRTLQTITLLDSNPGTVQAMQAACEMLLGKREPPAGHNVQGTDGDLPRSVTSVTEGAAASESLVHVRVVVGNIEDQQVNALVSPMLGHDPESSRVGSCLMSSGGSKLRARFEQAVQSQRTAPGGVLLVQEQDQSDGRCIFFLHCTRWDGNQQGTAVETLRQGLREVFLNCEAWAFTSVAVPMIGTGIKLGFPYHMAAWVLLEEIQLYEKRRASVTPFRVLIIIHSSDKNSTAALQTSQDVLHLRSFQMLVLPVQECFYRCISLSPDEITVMVGGVKLQVSFGDIIKETTDVIINTTNFIGPQTGLSAAVLTAAGSSVQAEFERVMKQAKGFCMTKPGSLACKAIVHVAANRDPDLVKKLCGKIVKFCEEQGYRSVSFPAVCAGAAGLAAKDVASLMLDGMASAVRDSSFTSVSLIRIVLLLRPVFDAFRCEVESRLGSRAPPPSLKERGKEVLKNMKNTMGAKKKQKSPTHPDSSSPSDSINVNLPSLRPLPIVLSVTGPGREAVRGVQGDLQNILQRQLHEREIKAEELGQLTQAELDSLSARAQLLELRVQQVEQNKGLGAWCYVVHGLRDKVLEFCEVAQQMVGNGFRRLLEEREQVLLGLNVQWSMCTIGGEWQNLDLHANYILEQEYLEGGSPAKRTIDGPGAAVLKVDIRKQEATDQNTGLMYKLKRMEISINFMPPARWEPMDGSSLKRVLLQPGSSEYTDLARNFHGTATNHTIEKIERVQNTHLWRAYQGKMEEFQDKNGNRQVGEKFLYHGTTGAACASIERGGFNRSFAGQNGTRHGVGVYFAVNAQYSAQPSFSPPDSAGLKHMFVARVLTGHYTLGNSSMKVPPLRPGSDSNNRFDSLVDCNVNPSMFVIFHDDQAYPDYLITFK